MEADIEDVRAFWDRRPCNVHHSKANIDTDPLRYSEEVTRRKYFVEPHIPPFAQFERWRGKQVLELGCGIGTDTLSFARAGAHVTAVDISERSLEIARKRARAHELDNIRFVCGDVENLPRFLKPEPYDLIYSFGALHHTLRPDRVVAHIRRGFMAPGGALKIMLYNRCSWKVLWILATYGSLRFWQLERLIAKHSEAQTGCPVTWTYTPKTARELLEGFVVEGMSVDHIFPYRVPDYIEHHYIKEWYWRLVSGRLFRWLERHFGCHLLITARLASRHSDVR